MIDGNKILDALRKRWESGETQAAIARAAGISQAYLCELISGKNNIDGLTIKKINKLFPEAELQLGCRIIGDNNTIIRSEVQCDKNFLPAEEGKLRSAIINAIIDLDIDDAAKCKVLAVVKNTNAGK